MPQALSKDCAAENILVNAVAITRSSRSAALRAPISLKEHYERTGKTVPIGHMDECEEVSNEIAFLASDAASYVTRCCINVDGG